MKKLFTLTFVFLLVGIGFSKAETSEEDRRYRNYTNNFIFNMEGIEFAVFPDGQFDFNYLQDRNGVSVFINNGNTQVSFNTGYDYNRFVQYDTYGAVIQVEQIPVFYDPYGRVNQIGNVNIFYNNGFVNRIGNLNVFYSRPGIINYHTGFINTFNRHYVYQPWHNYYAVPFVNRCIVYNTPYRSAYFPIRYSWSYHRNFWNTPTYYNGFYARGNVGRHFYRPYDRVNYRSFERGRRDARGRAVAVNNRVQRNRQAIATGRSQVTRNSTGRSATTSRSTGRATAATSGRSTDRATTTRTTRSSRNTNATVGNRVNTNTRATSTRNNSNRSNATRATRSSRNTNATVGNRVNSNARATSTRNSSNRSNATRTTRSSRNTNATVGNRVQTNTRATSTRNSSNRSNATRTTRSSRNTAPAASSRNTSRNTTARSTKTRSSRNTNASRSSRRK
ncbi:hypothetical protein LX97_02904 [Nonlabens dokdonensis]|uniref:Secreted protein n=2 Tax=Nonlabens dokdonensis TaxID=328515 RepID=L7WH74_NONDD|nr:secreted protein [Nonlabens dokdonensis]AGC78303.1 secreted protein [Nonlabens dokdonensis DSW-6]PZX37809.1 hypothetical protein LX97_02904 [Nonlabens dokdonensis]